MTLLLERLPHYMMKAELLVLFIGNKKNVVFIHRHNFVRNLISMSFNYYYFISLYHKIYFVKILKLKQLSQLYLYIF